MSDQDQPQLTSAHISVGIKATITLTISGIFGLLTWNLVTVNTNAVKIGKIETDVSWVKDTEQGSRARIRVLEEKHMKE